MSQAFFEKYWQNQSDGGHRYRGENFLKKEAKEKLYHLGEGDTLLDFGCGAGELTTYFCEKFRKVYGIDFSEAMLQQARKRALDHGLSNQLSFIQVNEQNAWEILPKKFDAVCCTAVVQYLDKAQIDSFISHAAQRINSMGKIIIFDAIDPRIYFLYRIGLFRHPRAIIILIIIRAASVTLINFLTFLKILKPSSMGFSYLPEEIMKISEKYHLQGELVWSMYYEYRYHLILKPKLKDS